MSLTFADIEALIATSAQEGLQLEFKHGHDLIRRPELRERQDIEFIKDVTGFSNAEGGTLIYGIDERELDGVKIAAAIAPVPIGALTVEALSQRIRSHSAPPVQGIEMTEFAVGNGERVVVLEI